MLVGEYGLRRLEEARVAIIGLGGVGAYAVEMICRSGVGHLLLLDCDKVSVSNRNRQLCALESTVGKRKTEVMAARLRDINPRVDISVLADFITPDNVPLLLDPYKIDFLVDAIDTLSPKIALISYCLSHNIKMVSSMGAGAKFDATQIRLADISKSRNCPLAHMMTDTNNYNNSIFPSTLQMASRLLETGLDKERIQSAVFDNFSESRMRLMGYMLQKKLVVLPKQHSAYMTLTEREKHAGHRQDDPEHNGEQVASPTSGTSRPDTSRLWSCR